MAKMGCALHFDTVLVQVQINDDNPILKWEIISINGPFGTKMAALYTIRPSRIPKAEVLDAGWFNLVTTLDLEPKVMHTDETQTGLRRSFTHMKDLTDETAFCTATLGTMG